MASPTATQFQCATDAAFATLVKSYDGSYITTLVTNTGELPKGQTLYARVRHQDSVVGWTPWSATKTFSIANYQKWVAYLNMGGSGEGRIYGLVTDASGNIYGVAAVSGWTKCLVFKLSSTGQILWQKVLTDTKLNNGVGIAIGPDGNIYVCGFQAFMSKWAPDGTLLWCRVPSGASSTGYSNLAVSTTGELYTAGNVYFGDRPTGYLTHWNANGGLLGETTYPYSGGTNRSDMSRISVDAANNIYGTGTLDGGAGALCIKHNLDGSVQWQKYLTGNGTYGSMGMGMAPGPDGSIYIVGVAWDIQNGIGNHAFIVRVSSTGALLWAKRTMMDGNGWAYAVAVDSDGNLYLAGHTAGPYINIMKLTPTGTILWQKRLMGAFGSVQCMTIAPNGTIILGGYITIGGAQMPFMCTVAPDGTGTGILPGITSLSWEATSFTLSDLPLYLTTCTLSIGHSNNAYTPPDTTGGAVSSSFDRVSSSY